MLSDSEPRTEAGRRLMTRGPVSRQALAAILAIEAEAARLALEDVAERVRGLPDGSLANSHGGAVLHGLVSRAAVLALLSTKEEGS